MATRSSGSQVSSVSKDRQFLKALAFGEKDGRPYVIVPAPPRGTIERWVELPIGENWKQLAEDNARLVSEKSAWQERARSLSQDLAAAQERAVEAGRIASEERTRRIKMERAINAVLRPMSVEFGPRLVNTHLRSALMDAGFHEQECHPWWSPRRWIGCPLCAPTSLLGIWEEFSEEDIAIRFRIFEGIHKWMREILVPALEVPADGEQKRRP